MVEGGFDSDLLRCIEGVSFPPVVSIGHPCIFFVFVRVEVRVNVRLTHSSCRVRENAPTHVVIVLSDT